MAHFLKAVRVFDKLLPAVHDVMYTKAFKEDDRDILFTSKNIFILKGMADLNNDFNVFYLIKYAFENTRQTATVQLHLPQQHGLSL